MLAGKMRRRASGTSVCSGAYGGLRKEAGQEETRRQDFYIGDGDDDLDLQLEDAPAQRSDARRRVCFADETADHRGQQTASLEDVMNAILALRVDYAQRTNLLASELAELSQRVGFDEAQARAAERSLEELRTKLEDGAARRHEGDSPDRVTRELRGKVDGLRAALDAYAEASATELDALHHEIAGLRRDTVVPCVRADPPKRDGHIAEHESPPTFAHLNAQDIMEVRQCSRRAWHAVLCAFDPPPVAAIRPPSERL